MILWFILISSTLWAKELSLLTFNLHGYHPMDEERRIIQRDSGDSTLSWSHLNYFSLEELKRGLEKRQNKLAKDVRQLKPDIIFLQEVGGGFVHTQKSCEDFYSYNTAQDLTERLSGYQAHVSCRGNIGWWTTPETFSDFSVLSESGNLIYAHGSNPYPFGLIIEGLAILTGPNVKVIKHLQKHIPINSEKETFALQLVKFTLPDLENKYWIAVNIHGGHKIQHFEQAVATRRFLTEFLETQKDKSIFQGWIIGGDFNAYEPNKEVSTTPWSYRNLLQTPSSMTQKLLELNNSSYKPFATVEPNQAKRRVELGVKRFFEWVSWKKHAFDGSLKEVSHEAICKISYDSLNPFCSFINKIDHLFLSQNLKVRNFSGIYRQNNWTDLQSTLSDHPGLYSTIEL